MHKLESELKIQRILKGSAPKMIALRSSSATSGLPGAWRCTGRSNEEMVDKFVHMGVIITSEVEDAFRAVPRGAFVPHDLQVEAYIDSPLRGEPHVHLSAPHMYATVLEALQLSPGMKNYSLYLFLKLCVFIEVKLHYVSVRLISCQLYMANFRFCDLQSNFQF